VPSTLEISPATVVAPLAALLLAVLVRRLHRRSALSALRVAVAVVVAVYLAGVVANTCFPVYLGTHSSSGLPWWELPDVVPLAGTESADAVVNVALFLPFGALLPIVARTTSAARVVVSGCLFSLAMELVQWLNAVTVHGGHVPDVNDLLANTLGAALGLGVLRVALLVPVLARAAAAATWPPASRGGTTAPSPVGSAPLP
jgi:uncharacterized protein (TIGR03382 family)